MLGETLQLGANERGKPVSAITLSKKEALTQPYGELGYQHESWKNVEGVHPPESRKLDALTNLVERGLVRPILGATLPLARMGEAHELLENGGAYALRGKVAIDVVGQTLDVSERFRARMASLKAAAL